MRKLRNIGYKIYLLINEQGNEEKFCNHLGFSKSDYNRLINGRLALNPRQLSSTASFFNITMEELINYENNDAYKNMVHCMSDFSEQEHCDNMLDIIDAYIDLREAAAK